MPAERSYLFVPGDRPERFAKALATGADRVVLDLEDAVLPDAKPGARDEIVRWLSEQDGARLLVRVNGTDTPWHDDDLRAMAALPMLGGLMLPKAESGDMLTGVRSRMGASQTLVALVETVRAVADLRDVAGEPGLHRLAFGSVDFCHEAGIRGQDRELDYVRSRLVLESRLAGLAPPIDGVTIEVRREDVLVSDVARARSFGFGAKLCIHPSQVAPVNRGFSPGEDEIAWAKRVVEACASGPGAIVVDGKLVDRPVRLQAEAVLAFDA